MGFEPIIPVFERAKTVTGKVGIHELKTEAHYSYYYMHTFAVVTLGVSKDNAGSLANI
jgi:hypothetical protein